MEAEGVGRGTSELMLLTTLPCCAFHSLTPLIHISPYAQYSLHLCSVEEQQDKNREVPRLVGVED